MVLMAKLAISVVGCLLVLLGCGPAQYEMPKSGAKKDASIVPKVASKMVGKWAVVADTSGRGDTGTLTLAPDGKFILRYKMPGKPVESCWGTYSEGSEVVVGVNKPTVSLDIKRDDKGPVSGSAVLRLFYDNKQDALTDYMTVTFVRRRQSG
jgi:hypothetical protein